MVSTCIPGAAARRPRLRRIALAVAALAAATQAEAQTQPANGEPTAANTVVVTGFRSSLQKALNLKQQAIGVRDSIVAEDIGKFPEANVA